MLLPNIIQLSPFNQKHPNLKVRKTFLNSQENKYFGFFRSHGFCCSYSMLALLHESSNRQYVTE